MRLAPSRLIIDSMDLATASVSGDVLFLDHLDARHRLQRLDGDGMRLVPAEIVARADIDDADRHARRAGDPPGCPDRQGGGRALQQAATGKDESS